MHGLGSKLSKHVLGMKFMRKTKDQLDKTQVERKHREHFSSDIKPRSSSTSAFPKLETIVEEVPSYSQCLGYKFGRLSFGGFNPTVEYNVRKRNWRAIHVGDLSSDEDEDFGSEEDVKPKAEVDVDDEEMAETYGSIIGTVGRQMMARHEKDGKHKGRRDKWRKRERPDREDQPKNRKEKSGEGSYGIDLAKIKNTVGGWARKGGLGKKMKKNKNSADVVYVDEEPSFSQNHQAQGQRQKVHKKPKESGAQPPQKKRKFMKPSEDYE